MVAVHVGAPQVRGHDGQEAVDDGPVGEHQTRERLLPTVDRLVLGDVVLEQVHARGRRDEEPLDRDDPAGQVVTLLQDLVDPVHG